LKFDRILLAHCLLAVVLLPGYGCGVRKDTATLHGAAQYWLKEYLLSKVEVLGDPASGDWEKVIALREWAYEQIPRAAYETSLLESEYGHAIYDEEPAFLLFRFQNNEGGFYCGGTAQVLADLYGLFGYRAYTYNMGNSAGQPTHMLTLVEIESDSRKIVSVQDAYLNFALTKDGKPLDFEELLRDLESDRTSDIRIRTGKSDCKPMIAKVENAPKARSYLAQHYALGPPSEPKNGRQQFCHDFSLGKFDGRSEYEDWLEQTIGRRDFLYIFLFPIEGSGGPRAVELAQRAAAIRDKLLPRTTGQ
jgi:hypothetical protein